MTDNSMHEDGSQAPGSGRTVERISPPDRPRIYANNVATRTSAWDFVMDFGMVLEADEQSLRFEDLVTVIMSPQHAKAFASVLAKQVQKYEEAFGTIPQPPEVDEDEAS